MHALEDLLTSLLRRNMTPQGLQIMVEVRSGRALPWGGGHPTWKPASCLVFLALPALGVLGSLVLSACVWGAWCVNRQAGPLPTWTGVWMGVGLAPSLLHGTAMERPCRHRI